MKAIVVREFGEPSVMKMEELPDPVPGPGQVVVNLKAAGVNPKDAHYRQGLYPLLKSPPFTPGIDGAGIIDAVGSRVGFKVGDRVYVSGSISGTYAEKALFQEYQVHLLPENITFSQGAGIGVPYGTAYRALFQQGRAMSDETILIHGASGGVGLAALQIARGSVFRIIATAGTEEGMKLVKEEGADLVLCHRDPDYLEEMIKLNGGKKIDVILEMQAHLNLNKDLSILAKRGRVVVVGSRGTIEINPQYLKDAEIEIRSVSLLVASREDVEKIHLGLQKGFSNGHLIPIIDEEFTLEEAPKAHHKIIKMGQKGKIVLRIA